VILSAGFGRGKQGKTEIFPCRETKT